MRSLSEYFQIVSEIAEGGGDLKNQPVFWNVYLAGYFDYNVRKGGFAQLLFNLKGEYLSDIEQMLREINAPEALNFYLKALEICLENITEYRRFIGSNYLEKNETKDNLHLLSLDYFKKPSEFSDEINPYLSENSHVLEAAVKK